eukprot:2842545-Prymnesium_polylepis.1
MTPTNSIAPAPDHSNRASPWSYRALGAAMWPREPRDRDAAQYPMTSGKASMAAPPFADPVCPANMPLLGTSGQSAL